ncbi:hypothetical protein BRETT_002548 [Brettanomyces bruxellensis]|uniref:BAR domain-containing protein n=1 Tax=Dekkera bruxellensis TaxID=5007 RepID=A0A871R925_DEKBR|nr:uncharacterized protein BRETT_002548 [Brettanomyces bruxellensis]QOU22369.1 hypothetical protein BRETT_002548 [Brettanomyces bruxellensis]
MSLRGLGKALYRTPHKLFGSKSDEDFQMSAWENDISTAMAGLDYINLQTKNWKKYWIDTATTLSNVLGILSDVHDSLDAKSQKDQNQAEKESNAHFGKPLNLANKKENTGESNRTTSDEQFTYITQHELKEAQRVAKIVFTNVQEMVDAEYKGIEIRCLEMKENLKSVAKLITKRNHKKMDYDMSFNNVEKAVVSRGSDKVEKDMSKLEHSQNKMQRAKEIFNNLDVKVRMVVPPVLEVLSEFMNKLTLKFYFANVRTMDFMRTTVRRFAQSQGLLSRADSCLTYKMIIEEFTGSYTAGQSKLQDLELLKYYKDMKEKNLMDKAVSGTGTVAGIVVNETADITGALYAKASKTGQKINLRKLKIENPVRPYRGESGIFQSATDPIQFELLSMRNEEKMLYDEASSSATEISDSLDQNTKAVPPPVPERDFSTRPSSISSLKDENDWLRPLSLHKNVEKREAERKKAEQTAAGKTADSPSSKTPSSGKFDTVSTDTSSTNTDPNSSVLSSLSTSENSETAKYASVKLAEIRRKVKNVVTTPEILSSPVTFHQDEYRHSVRYCRDLVQASSTISAHLFQQLEMGTSV